MSGDDIPHSPQALIPCAGQGSRLLPVTRFLDKSLLPLGRRTLMDWVLDSVSRSGVSQATITLPSSGRSLIQHHYGVASSSDLDLAFVTQETSAGDFASGVLAAWSAAPQCESYLICSPDAPAIAGGRAMHFDDLLADVLGGAQAAFLSTPALPSDPVQARIPLRADAGPSHEDHVIPRYHWAVSFEFLASLDHARRKGESLRLLEHAGRLVRSGSVVTPRLLREDEHCEDLGTWDAYERAFVRMMP